MTNRRGFMSIVAGAFAAGPAMAKQAVTELGSLNPGNLLGMGSVVNAPGDDGMGEAESTSSYTKGPRDGPYLRARSKNRAEYIRNNLIDARFRHPKAIQHDRLVHRIEALSPDIAGMRSISMVNKIRLSRNDQHDYLRHMEMRRYELELEGVFDDETDLIRDTAELAGDIENLPNALAARLSQALQRTLKRK